VIFSKGGFGSRGRRTGLLGVTWDLRCFLIFHAIYHDLYWFQVWRHRTFFRIFRLLFRIKKHQTEKQVTSLNMSADGSDTVRSCSKPPFHLPWGHKGCNIMLALTRRVKRMVRFGLQNRWLLLDALLPNYLILYNSWPIPRFFWWWL